MFSCGIIGSYAGRNRSFQFRIGEKNLRSVDSQKFDVDHDPDVEISQHIESQK